MRVRLVTSYAVAGRQMGLTLYGFWLIWEGWAYNSEWVHDVPIDELHDKTGMNLTIHSDHPHHFMLLQLPIEMAKNESSLIGVCDTRE